MTDTEGEKAPTRSAENILRWLLRNSSSIVYVCVCVCVCEGGLHGYAVYSVYECTCVFKQKATQIGGASNILTPTHTQAHTHTLNDVYCQTGCENRYYTI